MSSADSGCPRRESAEAARPATLTVTCHSSHARGRSRWPWPAGVSAGAFAVTVHGDRRGRSGCESPLLPSWQTSLNARHQAARGLPALPARADGVTLPPVARVVVEVMLKPD